MSIEYYNIKRYDNVDFAEYLKMPGYSNSWLKQERNGVVSDFKMTDNIKRGSLVDSILTEPHKVDMSHPLYSEARNIASTIKSTFGDLINSFQKQVSFTSDVRCGEFVMASKGRLDFLIENIAVIDLKCTQSKNLKDVIYYMKYPEQMWHYCKMAKVDKAYLMMYSIPMKKTEIIKVDCSSDTNDFWEGKIQKFGRVKEAA